MIGGYGRQSDVGMVTLRCQDMLVIDNHCNLNVMKANVTTLSAIDIHGYNGLPLLITSNVIFEEDASFQKDLILEGNLIAGSTHVLNLLGNVNIAQNLMVNGLIIAQTDVLIQRDLFVTRDLYLEGTLTILTDLYVNKNVIIEGNLSVYGNVITDFNIDGNVCMGNLKVQDLYVHTIHGFSPVNFNDIASFGKGANFKQLVKLLAADLQATLGARIKIKDGPSGGALECEDAAPIMMDKGLFHNMGGNVMVTKIPAAPTGGRLMLDGGDQMVMGGNVMVTKIPAAPAGGHLMLDGGDHMVMGGNIQIVEQGSGGGSIVVMGGNINVTGHSLTGRGSISVLDGGDINLRNGGSLIVNDGGNVVIENGGNIVLGGGGTIVIMGMTAEALTFPIPENQGGTKQISYATGDTLYASAPDTLAKLGIGTNGQVLTVSGGLPIWTTSGATPLSIFGATQSGVSQIIATGAGGGVVTFNTVNPNNVSIPGVWNGSNAFTVNVSGWFRLEGAINFGAVITNKFGLDFLINGVESIQCIGDVRLMDSGVLNARMHMSCTSYLTSGDIITLRARQTTGVSQTIVTASIVIQLV